MKNGKNNRLKKLFIIGCCMIPIVVSSVSVTASENKEKSCHEKVKAIYDLSSNKKPVKNDITIVQGIVDTYRRLPTDDSCKLVFEKELKILTRTVKNEITFYEKTLLSARLGEKEFSALRKNKKVAENIYFILEEVMPTAELEEKIIVTFADYPAFSINLYGGIESQSVDTITSPDIPRIGLLVYQSNNNDKRKGFHVYGNFLLTGSAEATESIDNDPEQTLEMNFNVFYAGWKKNLDDKYALFGPVVSVGALRTSVENEIYMPKKRYVGVRSALNPETYAEVLLGTTSGLKSKRLELRMQAPIERFKNGSRIFIGGVFNMAYDKRIDGEPESASIYLSWHVPFGKLWNVNDDE